MTVPCRRNTYHDDLNVEDKCSSIVAVFVSPCYPRASKGPRVACYPTRLQAASCSWLAAELERGSHHYVAKARKGCFPVCPTLIPPRRNHAQQKPCLTRTELALERQRQSEQNITVRDVC